MLLLRRRLGRIGGRRLVASVARHLVAAALMAMAVTWISTAWPVAEAGRLPVRVAALGAAILVGIATYGAALWATRAPEIAELREMVLGERGVTGSSGEGESVKFRDDTLSFDASFRQEAKSYRLEKVLRLGDLEMGPGDELYLHLEAIDNRRPEPQVTKTFKYIIAFENPGALTIDMSGGLAVDRLPEYFRSQRQIIIDTEKLIAREKELDEKKFNEQSNNG